MQVLQILRLTLMVGILTANTCIQVSAQYYSFSKWDGTAWAPYARSKSDSVLQALWLMCMAATKDGKLYCGAYFPTTGLAEFRNATWSKCESTPHYFDNTCVYNVALDTNDRVYCPGMFLDRSNPDTTQWEYVIAAFRWDTTHWTMFGKELQRQRSGFSGYVGPSPLSALIVDAKQELVCTYDASQTPNIHAPTVVRNNGKAWEVIGTADQFKEVEGLHVLCQTPDQKLYAAAFSVDTNAGYFLYKWNGGTSWSRVEIGQQLVEHSPAARFGQEIDALKSDENGRLYITGNFRTAEYAPYVAMWNGKDWLELGQHNFFLNYGTSYFLNFLQVFDSRHIYVSGTTNAFGREQQFIAFFNGTQWQTPFFSNSAGDEIIALDRNGILYAASDYVAPTGVSDILSTQELMTFPNPSDRLVVCSIPDCHDPRISIVSSVGVEVCANILITNDSRAQIDISCLTNGMYKILVRSAEGCIIGHSCIVVCH